MSAHPLRPAKVEPPGPPEPPDGDDEPTLVVEPEDTAGGSQLDELVGEREQIAQQTSAFFPIPNNPGRNGEPLLWGEYRLLGWTKVRGYAENIRVSRQKTTELHVAADMIAEALIGLHLRQSNGSYRHLPGGSDANPVRYDERVVEALRLGEPPDPRKGWRTFDIVCRVLDPRGVNLAVTAHQQELITWMEEAHTRVNDEFAGESRATPR